ncbi:MAG: FHA domain-containing protein [Bryobacterales bacterium]|nr:FHA domain-containing protein [Bryobacterales bacterium]
MVRCPEGHFYDPAKHTNCPWCTKPPDLGPAAALTVEPPEVITGIRLPTLPVPGQSGTFAEIPQTRLVAESTQSPLPGSATPPTVSVSAVLPIATPPAEPPPPAPPVAPRPAPTRRFANPDAAVDPVVGWLVCVHGPDRGRDWRLHAERNFIGRDPAQDVAISGDDTVSRDRHAILTFDPRKQEFKVQPGESTSMVYINGEALYLPQPLHNQDTIELGNTKLVFISFVNPAFQW